jgi:hypothetical protein
MTQSDPNTDCIVATIVGFMLPFFLAGAGGNQDVAKAAIHQLIEAYNASNPTELDLVGRIIGFSIVSMDNLRLSMTPNLSDAKVLRYRGNAVTLCRSSNQARSMLDALQAGQPVRQDVPRPPVAAAPAAPKPVPPVGAPLAATPNGVAFEPAMDIESMKRDARAMMAAFSKHGVPPLRAPQIADTAAMVKAAARAAIKAAA